MTDELDSRELESGSRRGETGEPLRAGLSKGSEAERQGEFGLGEGYCSKPVMDVRTLRSGLSSKRGKSGTLTFAGGSKTCGREARAALRSAIYILLLERKVRQELGLDHSGS